MNWREMLDIAVNSGALPESPVGALGRERAFASLRGCRDDRTRSTRARDPVGAPTLLRFPLPIGVLPPIRLP